jgi:hypothetical protein
MRTKENNYLSKYYTNESIKGKIDKRLHSIAALRANLGIEHRLENLTDRTKEELTSVNKEVERLEKEIKELDPEF